MRRSMPLVVGASAFVLAGVLGATPGTPEAAAKSRNIQREAQIELGRRLFLDPVASRGGQFSCASCHEPEHGFSDPRRVSVDENGATNRHSQPVTDLAGEGFHWDGEFDTVRQLLVARMGSAQAAVEQTVSLLDQRFAEASMLTDPPDRSEYERRRRIVRPPYYGGDTLTPTTPSSTPPVAGRLDIDGRYDEGFQRAYGTAEITPDRVVDAVDAYLATLETTRNGWDRYRRGEHSALSESAQRGLKLFRGKAGCDSCHVTRGDGAHNLSDGAFHSTGVAFRVTPDALNAAPLPAAEISLLRAKDAGRAGQSFVREDTAHFKTPSLRDVARRAPYMHDGSFETLAEVVDYYDGGGTPHPGLDEAIEPLGLTDGEKADLVSFLEALTGEERAGLGDAPAYRPKATRIRLRDPSGRYVPNVAVTVVPAGDRLRGTEEMPEPFQLTADKWGWIEFAFPASTQVRLESPTHEIAMSRLIADWTRKTEVIAAPRDHVTVTVHGAGAELPAELTLQPDMGTMTSDARFTLKRVREVSEHVAVYSASLADVLVELDRPMSGSVMARVESWRGTYAIDFDGGHSEPIDRRIDSTRAFGTTARPTALADRRERRTGGGVKAPEAREDPGRPNVPSVKRPDITPR